MAHNVLLPKSYFDIEDELSKKPLFFFAGPILGGGDWQWDMYRALVERLPAKDFYVALPCRYTPDHTLYSRQVMGGKSNGFDDQLSWERYYLDLAARQGCIVFWLPCESRTHPRNDGQPYATDTRGEIGRWSVKTACDPRLRMVFGAENGFPGLDVMVRNIEKDYAEHKRKLTFHSSLEETAEAAIRRALRKT